MSQPASKREPRSPMHPDECYRRNPWSGSPVVPFPVAANRPYILHLAIKIVGCPRQSPQQGIQEAVRKRALHLYQNKVPKWLADREIEEFACALTEGVELALEAQHDEA